MRGRRRTLWSALAVTVIAAVIATMAVLYQGFTTADVELNDGGVWVTDAQDSLVGHLNYPSRLLDGSFQDRSPNIALYQDGNDVLSFDQAAGALTLIDPAKLIAGGVASLTSGSRVGLRDGVLGIIDAGKNGLYVVGTDSVSGFSVTGRDPLAQLGAGSAVGVGVDGTVHAVSVEKSQVVSIAGTTAAPEIRSLAKFGDKASVSITAVGDVPVVLDSVNGVLYVGDKVIQAPEAKGGVLQYPGAASDNVLVATTAGLLEQPLDGGAATLVPVSGGTPSEPVSLAGCAYAVWSGSAAYVRDCPGDSDDVSKTIPGAGSQPQLTLRQNRNVVVVNELREGRTWLVNEDLQLVDNWEQVAPEDDEGEDESDKEELQFTLPNRDHPNKPPKAEKDAYGVRAGQTTLLPVLENDSDPDGDLLVASLVGAAPTDVTVQQVQAGAALQVTVGRNVSGTVPFTYQVNDGRQGGTAEAGVTLSVAPADANTAPRQESVRTMQLELGASGSYDATMKWIDPEGDNFYLKRAWSETGDRVTFRNNGMVQFTDSTGEIGVHEVKLLMSDGTDEAEGLLKINVRPEGAASPIANADRYTARVGEKLTVAPLANDLSVNGEELSLAKIDEQAGTQTALDQASGTFSFVANAPGTYYTQYLVTDGMKPAQGIVRVDVHSPDSSDVVPLASIDTALVPASRDVLVDVLANDTDPAGGILVVQSVTVPAGSKMSAEVLEHRAIRVRDTGGLDGPLTISYRVSNGARWADGYIRVIPVSLPQKLRAPVTVDDRAVVRAGDIVTVDVLANDYHPDGDDLELQSQLSETPDTVDGVAFVSEGKVRFKAGEKAKTVSLVYQVSDSQQNVNSAYLRIQIVAVDAQHNAAPIPQSVTARTIAGTSVRVPIPLSGTDPDGDSVELVGLASAPKKGRVSVGDSWLVYQAYPGTTGRDSFDYILRDRLGATATGTVVVGVVAPSNLNQAPYTARDEVEIRPGRSVSVPVLQNDSDPDGDDLALVSNALRATSDVKAEVVKSRVLVHAPAAEGQYAITYVAVDTFGAKAQGSLVVKVSATAPLQAPVARDDRVLPSALGEAKPVPVNVLENDEDPDGVADDLTVTSDSPFAAAGTNGVLTVTPQPQPQVVLYSITDADQESASAVVVVPGTDSMLPTLTSTKAVEVVAGKELSLSLADYVTVRPGRSPRISEADSLRAAHASNDSLVKDERTLTYTAGADYFGPDAIAVMVTDGDGPDDPEGNSAYVAIPILVLPAKNQPPTFLNTEVQVAPREEAADLNWRKLSNDPDPGDLAHLSLEVTSKPDGISARAEGDHLLIAAESAKPGSQGEVVVAVKDGTTPPTKGTVKVTVTTSQRPLPVAVDDVVTRADQGKSLSIDVLANDLPNPFPDTPLTLIDAALVSGDGTVRRDGSKVIVTPGADFHGTLLGTYRVQDATRTADRQAEGKIRVTVQGRPDRPEKPVVVSEGNREVKLSWTPPPNNGRPILGYTVTSAVDNVSQKCPSTNCTIKGLRNNVKYTFAVVATNEVGDSDKSPTSAVARPDVRPNTPEPPEVVRTDRDKGGALDVKWKDPGGEGSKVQNYDLVLDQGPNKPKVTTTSLTWDGLTNGTWYRIKVRARNLAKDPSEWSEWSVKAKPFGIPDAPGQPDTRPATPVGNESQITVSWPAVSGDATNGDDVKDYDLEVRRGGTVVDTLKGISATHKNVVVATSTSDYTFRVRARNGAGESDWSPASAPRRAANPPGAPSGLKVTPGDQKLTVDFSMADADLNGSKRSELTFFYKLNNSGGGRITSGDAIGGLTNGTKYTVTVWAESDVEGVTPGAKASDADNVPFGKPKIYLDGIDRLDNAVRFRWHVDDNGAPLTSENPKLKSDGTQERTYSGLPDGGKATIDVSYGNKADTVAAHWEGYANDPPPPSVSVYRGDYMGPCPVQGPGPCYEVGVETKNFSSSVTCTLDGGYATTYGANDRKIIGGSYRPWRGLNITFTVTCGGVSRTGKMP